MNRAQRIANKRANRANRDGHAGQPAWMAKETPAQRRSREWREAKRRANAEAVGREYVPPWIRKPECTPVYANDGTLVSWRPSKQEQVELREQIDAVTTRAIDWVHPTADIDGLFDAELSRLSPDEKLRWYCENQPDAIVDADVAKSCAHNRAINGLRIPEADLGSVIADPWSF